MAQDEQPIVRDGGPRGPRAPDDPDAPGERERITRGHQPAGRDGAPPRGAEPAAPGARIVRRDAAREDGAGETSAVQETDERDAIAAANPNEEEMPRVRLTRRRLVAFGVFIVSGVAFLYFVLPKLTGVSQAVHHIEDGDAWWIGFGAALELCSFAGYIVLFRAVFVRDNARIGWTESYQITMAGVVATRLFAAAGAGGVALTAWALRRSGMGPRTVACRMVAFMVLLYVVYMGAMLLDGIALRSGLLPGGGSFAITVIPAIAAGVLFAVAAAIALVPGDLERRLGRLAAGSGRRARLIARAATVPALTSSGVRTAIRLVRERNPGVLGAPAWWGFDIAVLWAMFHAFGSPPPVSVVVMAYFVGTLGNLLPLPGGLGGVEGGMIGAFAAFGVPLHLAVVSVLAYRALSFWLPTIPGAIAYFQLRRTVARWREEQEALPQAGLRPGAPAPAGLLQGS